MFGFVADNLNKARRTYLEISFLLFFSISPIHHLVSHQNLTLVLYLKIVDNVISNLNEKVFFYFKLYRSMLAALKASVFILRKIKDQINC